MIPEVDGVVTAGEIRLTAETIAAEQLRSGLIPWCTGAHADPWNHTEAAMALAVAGLYTEAERAYEWLAANQRTDGAWHQYYVDRRIEDPKLDANVCAYPATGVWHHWSITRDRGFLESMWPVIDRAIDFVIQLQAPGGEIRWARHPDGTAWPYALLTGSSSISHSLRCAIAIAEELGFERPDWELAAVTLVDAIRHRPGAFQPKGRWAMDWYYPVLCGALRGAEAEERLSDGWDRFVLPGRGVRCVDDREWITAAETNECVIAHLAAGLDDAAHRLFGWGQALRADDGSYFTGVSVPADRHYPPGERSTYTAAAVILAADALAGVNPTSGLFTDAGALPEVAPLESQPELD